MTSAPPAGGAGYHSLPGFHRGWSWLPLLSPGEHITHIAASGHTRLFGSCCVFGCCWWRALYLCEGEFLGVGEMGALGQDVVRGGEGSEGLQ